MLPDLDSRNALAEFTGHIFTRNSSMKLEKALLLYGSGGTIGTLIGVDRSLQPAAQLEVGKGLWRDPVGLVWNDWD